MANGRGRRAPPRGAGGTGNEGRGSSFTDLARKRPLLVVGAGVIVGMAIGGLLPWSRMENELLADKADKLKDGAKELASNGVERLKSVAQHAYGAANDALRESESGSSSGKIDADLGERLPEMT